MDKTESQLKFYREQITTWRWKDWSWERICMEERGPDVLERKLEGRVFKLIEHFGLKPDQFRI